jgi:serine phosphatase RsbU (regulator of sigma subunit)
MPALGLAAVGGTLELAGLGGGLLAGAAAALAIDLAILQPRIDRRFLGAGDPLGAASRAFLAHALGSRTIGEIAMHLGDTVGRTLGIEKCLLVTPAPDGGVQVLGGEGGEARLVGDAELAFLWLGERGAPVDRAGLEGLREFEGARATDDLLARLGGEAALPLRHRGLLLGVAVLGASTHPVAPSELERFYRGLGAFATVALANTYLDVQARGKGSLSRAFDLATALQEALMPDDRPLKRSGVSLRGMYRPVAECGGDLWLYQELGKGRLLVLVADATGHGAAPAMLTAVAKGGVEATRHVAGANLDPGQLLASLNRSVYRAGRTRYLMTAFAAVIDSQAGEIRFANAGQNFPYAVSRAPDGRPKVEPLIARGNALGSAAEAKFAVSIRELAVGERIVFFTDGITDAGAPIYEPFGEKRFRAVLAAHADTPAARLPEAILGEVDAFLAGRPFSDDLTIVAAELLAPEDAASTPTPHGSGGSGGGGSRP